MEIASDVPFLAASRTISPHPTYFCPYTSVRGTREPAFTLVQYRRGITLVQQRTWHRLNAMLLCWQHVEMIPPCCLLLMTNFSCGAVSVRLRCVPGCVRRYSACHRWKPNVSLLYEICEQRSGACSASA